MFIVGLFFNSVVMCFMIVVFCFCLYCDCVFTCACSCVLLVVCSGLCSVFAVWLWLVCVGFVVCVG